MEILLVKVKKGTQRKVTEIDLGKEGGKPTKIEKRVSIG